VSRVDRTVTACVLATLCAVVVLITAPEHAALVGHALLVVVLALALGLALGRLRDAMPRSASRFDAAFAPARPTRARPATLARMEREVSLATGTAFDVHFRLRPLLLTISTGLLLRRGIDLARRPDRAEELLGPNVWELVRPDRPSPADRTAPGIPIASVESAVDDLERLEWS
jgi:hypothetical protein